ncbi:MAG TPA: recombinase family protein [Gemmataceae bacterium]|jgi:DNA invertase Pin-like site-specific DNA recombinase/predicted transcriptional regulator|nr:recombinase family protein [Gemmataceae bacterium]
MIKKIFDPTQPLSVIFYLRMSSSMQNPRSPDQQRDTIVDGIRRNGYPWKTVATYTDAGISGRLMRGRPRFQAMLHDIAMGRVRADAIATDTFERFGRGSRFDALRTRLREQFGVLVLTCDSNFMDPNTAAGQITAALEGIRGGEDNRIKAHNVLRGKRDAVKLKHWPGGPPPFGYRIENVMTEKNGRQEVAYSILVPDAQKRLIIVKAYTMAADHGLGCVRITRQLNNDPSIPDEFKPFVDQTVLHWLKSKIYKGVLVYPEYATDIVDDRKIKERNSSDEVLIINDYCEPLVTEDMWERAQIPRRARGERVAAALRAAREQTDKTVSPLVPGIALKYILSGMVRCGECRRAMVCGSSAVYTMASGEEKRYVHYHCPARPSGLCTHRRRFPEEWLRGVVVDLVRRRLFPVAGDCDAPASAGPRMPIIDVPTLLKTDWFVELTSMIQEELDRTIRSQPDQRSALETELRTVEAQCRGWIQSISNPNLAPEVRLMLETEMTAGAARRADLVRRLQVVAAMDQNRKVAIDPQAVLEKLQRLSDVLAANDPTRGNIELCMHIDGIYCYDDGRVVVRTCKLGALAGVADLLGGGTETSSLADSTLPGVSLGTPRRLARRRLLGADPTDEDLASAADWATDTDRFAGLGDEWFWEDWFQLPSGHSWAEANARAVSVKRKETGWTIELLAAHFGKTAPTIRKALKHAHAIDPELAQMPRKIPRARWEDSHYLEVLAMRKVPMTIAAIAKQLGISTTIIRRAIALGKEKAREESSSTSQPTKPHDELPPEREA